MEIQVIKVEKEEGKEMVVIKASEDCNLASYILFDTTFDEDDPSNLNRHSYMFPNQSVKANDFVLLYTGEGEDKNYPNRAGSTTWEFYWGLDVDVWNTDGDEVILVKVSELKRYPC